MERTGGGDEVEEVACENSLGDPRGDLADICSLGEVGRVGFGGGRLLASGPDKEVVVEVDACLDSFAEDKFAEVWRRGAVEGGESGGFEERVGSEVVRAVSAATVSPGEDVGEDGRGIMGGCGGVRLVGRGVGGEEPAEEHFGLGVVVSDEGEGGRGDTSEK